MHNWIHDYASYWYASKHPFSHIRAYNLLFNLYVINIKYFFSTTIVNTIDFPIIFLQQ
jgi:hypothetical protein